MNEQMTYREAWLKGYDCFRADRDSEEMPARIRAQVPLHFHQAALGGYGVAIAEHKRSSP
jgi:hypothetical protein